jgi:hypothetical protein
MTGISEFSVAWPFAQREHFFLVMDQAPCPALDCLCKNIFCLLFIILTKTMHFNSKTEFVMYEFLTPYTLTGF